MKNTDSYRHYIMRAFTASLVLVMTTVSVSANAKNSAPIADPSKTLVVPRQPLVAPQVNPIPQRPAAGAPAVPKTNKDLVLFRFTTVHKQNAQLVLTSNTVNDIRSYSRKNAQLRVPDMCNRSALNNFVRSIPAEVMAFKIAEGIEVGRKIGGDPQKLKTFYDQSLMNADTYLTFVGFMMANHGTTALFQSLGWVANPCNKIGLRLNAAGRASATPAQVRFGKIAPYIGMSAGLIASSVMGEAIALFRDPDFKYCVGAHLSTRVDAAVEKACERVFEEWTVSHKIQQYMPDIFACLGAFAIQHYVAGPLAGLIKASAARAYNGVVPVAMRTFNIAFKFGSILNPVGGFAVKVGGQVFFMVVTHYITPPLKRWNDGRMQGNEIASTMNRLKLELGRAKASNWNWTPDKKAFCTSIDENPWSASVGQPVMVRCNDTKTTIPYLLDRYQTKSQKFRNYLIQPALDAHAKWQEYVMNFQNLYTTSYNFYSWYMGQMSAFKNGTQSRLPLFEAQALKGIRSTSIYEKDPTSGKVITYNTPLPAIEEAIAFLDKYTPDVVRGYAVNGIVDVGTLQALRDIKQGLKVFAATDNLPELKRLAPTLASQLENTPADLRNALINQISLSELERAISLMNFYLINDYRYSDRGYGPLGSAEYRSRAKNNLFAGLRLILGNPNPIPEGLAAIADAENDPTMINQELKSNYPKSGTTSGIGGKVSLSTITSYLTYSMMCGPDADPNAQVQWEVYRRQTSPWWERMVQWPLYKLGFNTGFYKPDPSKMVQISRYAQEAKSPGFAARFDGSEKGGSGSHKSAFMSQETALATFRSGIVAEFRPPRITDQNLCNVLQYGPREGWNGKIRYGNKLYSGYLPLLKDFTRKDLLGAPGAERKTFQEWWVRNVDPAAMRAIDWFYADFNDTLDKEFAPAFHNKEKKTIDGVLIKYGLMDSIKYDLVVYTDLLKQALIGLNKNANKTFNNDTGGTFQLRMFSHLRLMLGLSSKWGREKATQQAEALLGRKYGGPLSKMSPADAQARVENLYTDLSKRYDNMTDWMANYAGLPKSSMEQIDPDKLTRGQTAALSEEKLKGLTVDSVSMSTMQENLSQLRGLKPGSAQEVIHAALTQIRRLKGEADTYFGMYNTIAFKNFSHAPPEKADSEKSEADRDAELNAYLNSL